MIYVLDGDGSGKRARERWRRGGRLGKLVGPVRIEKARQADNTVLSQSRQDVGPLLGVLLCKGLTSW